MVSILGMVVLNTMFLEINWGIITAHEDYVPFPATGTRTKLCDLWEKSESTRYPKKDGIESILMDV